MAATPAITLGILDPGKFAPDLTTCFPRFYRLKSRPKTIFLFVSNEQALVVSHTSYERGSLQYEPLNMTYWEPCEVGFTISIEQKY